MRWHRKNTLSQGAEPPEVSNGIPPSPVSSDSFTKGGDANGKANKLALTDTQGQERAGASGGPPPRRTPHFPDGPQYDEPPLWQVTASVIGIIALTLWMLWVTVGCSGSSPTSPGSTDRHYLETQWGTATVEVLVDDWDGMDALEASADTGIARIAAQGYTMNVDPLVITIESECTWSGGHCAGKLNSKYHVLIVDGIERAMDHELQHAACRQIHTDRRGNECCRLQDHPNGYDLNCRRLG